MSQSPGSRRGLLCRTLPASFATASFAALTCKAGEMTRATPPPTHTSPRARARGLREQTPPRCPCRPTPARQIDDIAQPGSLQLVGHVTVPRLAPGASMPHTPCRQDHDPRQATHTHENPGRTPPKAAGDGSRADRPYFSPGEPCMPRPRNIVVDAAGRRIVIPAGSLEWQFAR